MEQNRKTNCERVTKVKLRASNKQDNSIRIIEFNDKSGSVPQRGHVPNAGSGDGARERAQSFSPRGGPMRRPDFVITP